MKKGLKYSLMKTVGYLSYNLLKILPTGGKSYPGYLFLRYAGLDSLGNLTKEQIKDGSILITGTNGKTTTTTMIIDLMSNDVNISKSVDNNTIDANVYNYFVDENISFTLDLELPLFGVHNVYNVLAATSTYACFTPKPENIEEKLKNYFNNIDLSILPPGRFEVLEYADKLVGIGQGDNGDALKVNYDYMNHFIQGNDYEFIYCTPDVNEEEIFEDHLNILKKINPTHITVIPGRVSVDVAKTYYTQIKDNNLNASFKSIEYDFEKRASGIIDSINESEYKYVVVSGCGEEHDVWNVTLNKLKE